MVALPTPSTMVPGTHLYLLPYRKTGLGINHGVCSGGGGILDLNTWNFSVGLLCKFPWRTLGGDQVKDESLDSAGEEFKRHSKNAHSQLGSLLCPKDMAQPLNNKQSVYTNQQVLVDAPSKGMLF